MRGIKQFAWAPKASTVEEMRFKFGPIGFQTVIFIYSANPNDMN